jgi:riboflavin kinase/FMN adenylyltransferase
VIEVHIFDFEGDLYGKTLRVHLHHYLRGEVKFNGIDELKQQLAKDKMTSADLLDKA